GRLRALLDAVRAQPRAARDDPWPRRPGLLRRRADTDGAGHRSHSAAAAADADRHEHLRRHCAARPGDRSRDRRLSRRRDILALAGFIAMAAAQKTSPDPVIKLALLRSSAFASATFITLVVGAAVYGTTFVVPQFLASIAGYNPRQAGGIMALAAIPVFVL